MAHRARVGVNPAAGRSRCRAPAAVRRVTRSTSGQSPSSRLLDQAAARHLRRRRCSGTPPGWRCACRARSCGNGHRSHTKASRNPTPPRGGTHLAYCPSRRGTRRRQTCAPRATLGGTSPWLARGAAALGDVEGLNCHGTADRQTEKRSQPVTTTLLPTEHMVHTHTLVFFSSGVESEHLFFRDHTSG